MGKNIRWTEDLKNEMFSYFEQEKENNSGTIDEIAENFAKLYGNMTGQQVRNAYYHFMKLSKNEENNNTSKSGNSSENTEFKKGNWSEKENSSLLKMVENKGNKKMNDVFEIYSKKYNRPVRNVKQHYYTLMSDNENEKNNENDNGENKRVNISSLIRNVKSMPNEVASRVADMIESMSKTINK